MKRVTGSNAVSSANKVSIQLALDGHSFSVSGVPEEAKATAGQTAAVLIEILTPRTMLVPAALFDASAEHAAALLAAAGMPARTNDEIVWSDTHAETVALMAVGREAIDTVRERFGGKISCTTPLLQEMTANSPVVWMYRAAGLLYIKVFGTKLLLAEVMWAPSDEDVLCIVERLGEAFAWDDYTLHISGRGVGTLRKLLGNRFKTIVCE